MNINLNGIWTYRIDPNDKGVEDKWFSREFFATNAQKFQEISIPSNFNIINGLEYYNGAIWFFKKIPEMAYRPLSHEYSIEFDSVNYIAEIWLNGYKIGSHEGDFLPFRFEFSPRLLSFTEDNILAVKVDPALKRDGIPADVIPWFNWGGIHRDVQILILEKTRVKGIKITTTISTELETKATIQINFVIKNHQEFLDRCYASQKEPQIEYALYYLGRIIGGEQQFTKILIQSGIQDINPESLKPLKHIKRDNESIQNYFDDVLKNNEIFEEPIDLFTYFNSTVESVSLTKEESQLEKSPVKEQSELDLSNEIKISVLHPALWTPESPELYELKLRLHGIDEDKYIRFGIREINQKHEKLFLNHQPIKLKGIIFHEEAYLEGRKFYLSEKRKEILDVKSLGFNAIKTGNYPFNEKFLTIADEEGILIVEEIPLYGELDSSNEKTIKLLQKYVKTIISRDYNHPSVIIWSLGSHLPVYNRQFRKEFKNILLLNQVSQSNRILTYSSDRYLMDRIRSTVPVSSISMVYGRDTQCSKNLSFFLDMIVQSKYKTPWIVSEFGCDGFFGFKNPHKKYSEEFQAQIIEYYIKIFNSKSYIAGWFLSSYKDYRIVQTIAKNKQKVPMFDYSGILSKKGEKKLSYFIILQIINELNPKNKNYTIFASILGYIFRFIEIFYDFQRAKMNKKKRTQNNLYYDKLQGLSEE